MKRAERITSQNHDQLWALKDQRISAEEHKNDGTEKRNSTGVKAKDKETIIRDMTLVNGITWSTDLRARSCHKDDIRTRTEDGEDVVIEVKHGGGALAYACTYELECFESTDRDLCLPGVDYVCYHESAKSVSNDRHEIADEYIVATREDFLDMLEEYCHGPRTCGWRTAVKFGNSDRNTIQIQSQYTKQFFEGLQSELGARTMTLYTFCVEVLGREPRWK